ncbi:MAG TPA: non-homologous end-joining DNA ligase [Pyrinomonadaceae bacterium]|jgi:bifunctional non-homologous end joining protein LigD
MGLETYKRKRNFKETPEPAGRVENGGGRQRFVIHEHHASILHWDFRLEIGGVLKSWSIPKGPSLDPGVKRLAVEVEDHPSSYFSFKGVIPEGNYGAGTVYRWDEGTFEVKDGDPLAAWESGSLRFELLGQRLRGGWRLFKMKGRKQGGKPLWLLQKLKDRYARAGHEAEITGAEDEVVQRARKSAKKAASKPAAPKRTRTPDAPAISVDEFLALRKPKGDMVLDVDGEHVQLTSLERVYWPTEKITKFELLRYYLRLSAHIMPYLKDRPAILQRYPRGLAAPKFFQHDIESAPRFIKVKRMRNEEGRELDYAVYTTTASLLHFVNLGTIEQHPWNSTVKRLTHPDWLVIDLDPHDAPWKNVLEVARLAREVFAERNLRGFPKTSGSSGIHIYLRLEADATYQRAAALAHELAGEIAARAPKIATIERSLAEREKQQVYVDWLQNARGKSVASPYTVRAKPKATVSMPLNWEQVEKGIRISDFNIKNVPQLVAEHGDAWKDFFKS